MDTFDASLRGACHEAFSRGMMAFPAGVRVEDRLYVSHEKVMERFSDVVCHTHELIIHGGWVHAPCYEVINGPRNVVQTERERCRGIPGEVF